MKKYIITTSIIASVIFTGCSFSNPFGIGEEKSACEVSSGFGVCGSPKKIYTHRDKIKKMQQEYMQSGYEDELFFGINDNGDILVKSDRDDHWQTYKGSKIEKEINEKLAEKKEAMDEYEGKKVTVSTDNSSLSQDVPVTVETDLSIKYKEQKPLIETRTNVGDIIRDNGMIQKVWIAPVKDDKGDLISAHELYVVIKSPDWIIGEATPKDSSRQVGEIPTPFSKNLIEKVEKSTEEEDKILKKYNNNDNAGLAEAINNQSSEKEDNADLNLINNYLKEK